MSVLFKWILGASAISRRCKLEATSSCAISSAVMAFQIARLSRRSTTHRQPRCTAKCAFSLPLSPSIQAKIEGREPPTELPPEEVVSDDDKKCFSSPPLIHSDEREEDPIQRELRLRAEAKERLQKKFGAGGLGSQAVGSSPIPPGGYGNQPSQSSSSWNTDESPLSSPHTQPHEDALLAGSGRVEVAGVGREQRAGEAERPQPAEGGEGEGGGGLVLALQHCQLAVVGGQGDGVLAGGGAGRGRCDEACESVDESVDASVGESVDESVDTVSEPTDNAGDAERRGEAGDGEGADAGGGEKGGGGLDGGGAEEGEVRERGECEL